MVLQRDDSEKWKAFLALFGNIKRTMKTFILEWSYQWWLYCWGHSINPQIVTLISTEMYSTWSTLNKKKVLIAEWSDNWVISQSKHLAVIPPKLSCVMWTLQPFKLAWMNSLPSQKDFLLLTYYQSITNSAFFKFHSDDSA